MFTPTNNDKMPEITTTLDIEVTIKYSGGEKTSYGTHDTPPEYSEIEIDQVSIGGEDVTDESIAIFGMDYLLEKAL